MPHWFEPITLAVSQVGDSTFHYLTPTAAALDYADLFDANGEAWCGDCGKWLGRETVGCIVRCDTPREWYSVLCAGCTYAAFETSLKETR